MAAKFISSAPAYSPIQGAEKVSGYPTVEPGGTSKVRGPLKASPRQSAVTERGAAPGFTMGICRHQTGSPGMRWCSAVQACIENAACSSSRPATTGGGAAQCRSALKMQHAAAAGLPPQQEQHLHNRMATNGMPLKVGYSSHLSLQGLLCIFDLRVSYLAGMASFTLPNLPGLPDISTRV